MKRADESHPGVDELECFMRGELARCEVRVVVRHLLTGCPKCVAVTSKIWDHGGRAPRQAKTLLETTFATSPDYAARKPGQCQPTTVLKFRVTL